MSLREVLFATIGIGDFVMVASVAGSTPANAPNWIGWATGLTVVGGALVAVLIPFLEKITKIYSDSLAPKLALSEAARIRAEAEVIRLAAESLTFRNESLADRRRLSDRIDSLEEDRHRKAIEWEARLEHILANGNVSKGSILDAAAAPIPRQSKPGGG